MSSVTFTFTVLCATIALSACIYASLSTRSGSWSCIKGRLCKPTLPEAKLKRTNSNQGGRKRILSPHDAENSDMVT